MHPDTDSSDGLRPHHTDFVPARGRWREQLYHIIFESESMAGKAFDLVLIVAITASVVAVALESIPSVRAAYGAELIVLEWIFTGLFTVEYLVRLSCVRYPLNYAKSFFGIVDLISIMPSFIAILLPQGRYILVVRVLRLLRIFRVLKLAPYVAEANLLMRAMHASRRKINVFLFTVVTLVIVIGAAMHVIEGPEHGFTSIPRSIYWAIVTLTTVGYGDISPQTPLGQAVASMVMIVGYAIIAVPTGIVTSEMTRLGSARQSADEPEASCPRCESPVPTTANYCGECGERLP